MLKGKITKGSKILDAVCGTGRNSRFFIENGYQIKGFDPNENSIVAFQKEYPNYIGKYVVSDIESFKGRDSYDFVTCNAVLHFAESLRHFRTMIDGLSSFLNPTGTLFIRMTSDFAVPKPYEVNKDGRSELPDVTERYLLSKKEPSGAMTRNRLYFVEPLKTINVNDERRMSTIVLTKNESIGLDLGWLAPNQNPMMK